MFPQDVIDDIIAHHDRMKASPLPEIGDPHPHERIATNIIALLHEAETALVGQRIVTVAGNVGTITAVRVHNEHGLTYALEGNGFAPASTIRDFA
jgi:hypothetical protein